MPSYFTDLLPACTHILFSRQLRAFSRTLCLSDLVLLKLFLPDGLGFFRPLSVLSGKALGTFPFLSSVLKQVEQHLFIKTKASRHRIVSGDQWIDRQYKQVAKKAFPPGVCESVFELESAR